MDGAVGTVASCRTSPNEEPCPCPRRDASLDAGSSVPRRRAPRVAGARAGSARASPVTVDATAPTASQVSVVGLRVLLERRRADVRPRAGELHVPRAPRRRRTSPSSFTVGAGGAVGLRAGPRRGRGRLPLGRWHDDAHGARLRGHDRPERAHRDLPLRLPGDERPAARARHRAPAPRQLPVLGRRRRRQLLRLRRHGRGRGELRGFVRRGRGRLPLGRWHDDAHGARLRGHASTRARSPGLTSSSPRRRRTCRTRPSPCTCSPATTSSWDDGGFGNCVRLRRQRLRALVRSRGRRTTRARAGFRRGRGGRRR